MPSECLTIYLAGPINGRTDSDCKDWREEFKSKWQRKTLDPMARDYRGREQEPGIASEIVLGDMEDIGNSDALVVYFDKPSVGTAMEVFYASSSLSKKVVVINVSGKPLSPWMTHFASSVVDGIGEAISWLSENL